MIKFNTGRIQIGSILVTFAMVPYPQNLQQLACKSADKMTAGLLIITSQVKNAHCGVTVLPGNSILIPSQRGVRVVYSSHIIILKSRYTDL